MEKRIGLIRSEFNSRVFVPSPEFPTVEQQTAQGFSPHLEGSMIDCYEEEVTVADGHEIKLDISLQQYPDRHPTMLIVPGLLGSGNSSEVTRLGIAALAEGGFNIARMSQRSRRTYHPGLTEDLNAVISYLANTDLNKIYLVGFSLGGNMVLKAAGENSDNLKKYVLGVAAVSPVVDLAASAEYIKKSPFEKHILAALKSSTFKRMKAHPEDWGSVARLKETSSIEEWDLEYQLGPERWGFTSLRQYYREASAAPLVGQIKVPTLLIHSEDDPIAPVRPLFNTEVVYNPNIIHMITQTGGHLGFVDENNEHWANNQVINFGRLVAS
ncbi:MAG: alpha/beta fold hydrolase [Candidatus Daviesbacteria bacterium]|nr:alpha/beta fold hydrolase [Candidatus Daviesbacteria bacterium]